MEVFTISQWQRPGRQKKVALESWGLCQEASPSKGPDSEGGGGSGGSRGAGVPRILVHVVVQKSGSRRLIGRR